MGEEQKAEDMGAKAKEAKGEKSKKARDEAEVEVKKYRAELKAKVKAEVDLFKEQQNDSQLDIQTQKELALVQQDYEKYKRKAMTQILDKVLDVRLQLSTVQKMNLGKA